MNIDRELVKKGAVEYRDALEAVYAFQREVQNICKDVYRKHHKALAIAMGLPHVEVPEALISPEDLSDLEDGWWAFIGVKRKAQPSCEFWLALCWRIDDEGNRRFCTAVILGLYYVKTREQIYESLRRKNPRVERENTYSLGIYSDVHDLRVPAIKAALDRAVRDWIRLCKSVGGLKLSRKRIQRRRA